jgi:hypothetical protein
MRLVPPEDEPWGGETDLGGEAGGALHATR